MGDKTDCLECQRLKTRLDAAEREVLRFANRWLLLKRFVLDQEAQKSTNANPDQAHG